MIQNLVRHAHTMDLGQVHVTRKPKVTSNLVVPKTMTYQYVMSIFVQKKDVSI